jgi:hypothetical protein
MSNSQPRIADATKTALASLLTETAKTPKPLTVEQLILRERSALRAMFKNGHSHDDAVAVFAAHDLTVSGETITAIIAKAGKKKAAKGKQPDLSAEASLSISHEQAAEIAAEWTRLSTIRKGFTRQELVVAMQAEIDAALEAGYTFADLAALLETKGVTIAPSSLQRYHRIGKRQEADETVTEEAPSPPSPTPRLPRPSNAPNLLDEAFGDD